jgi:hypothetical protein
MLIFPPPVPIPFVRPLQLGLGFVLGWILRGRSDVAVHKETKR